MNEIVRILMARDGLDRSEAEGVLEDAASSVMDDEDPEEILHELGLEPDYIFDLLEACQ